MFIKFIISCLMISNVFLSKNTESDFYNHSQRNNNQVTDIVEEKQYDSLEEFAAANDTEEGLNLLLEDYQDMLENSTDENEINSLQQLISALSDIIENEQSNKGIQTYDNGGGFGVGTIINWFNLNDYKLSAELLLFSTYSGTSLEKVYNPVNASRVLSSPLIYDIASSNTLTGSGEFKKSGTTFTDDLFFSIHYFNYFKTNTTSKNIKIRDTYDYADEQYNPDASFTDAQQTAINWVIEAQKRGEISYFQVEFSIDISEALKISIIGIEGIYLKVKVINSTYTDQVIFYNKQTTNESNADNWNLNEVDYTFIAKNDEVVLDIKFVDITEKYIPISYIRGNKRIINIGVGYFVSEQLYLKKVNYQQSGSIEIVGKNKTKWLIKIINQYDDKRRIEYNSKMCFLNDGLNWENLEDIESFVLNRNQFKIVEIEENVFADAIAVRYIEKYYTETRHIGYNLNIDSTMDIQYGTYDYYPFLNIENKGKEDNKWKINIINPCDYKITVQYNTKMCFYDDANQWKSLNDIATITINPFSNYEVEIQENWFATCIAISYLNQRNQRLITFANNLNDKGNMTCYNNVI